MNKEFIKGQLKGALSWLNTLNTNKNVLHAKDSINMALKELDDLKIYKKKILINLCLFLKHLQKVGLSNLQ